MGSGSPILPGVGLGFGAELGPLYMVQGTMLYSSIEASFGQESAVYQFPGGHIDGGMQRLPIIISAKLISKSQLSPFLKLGLGYAKTDFREISTYSDGHNIRFHKWHPVSEIGGGLNYQVSQSTAFEIFVDSWFYGGDLYGRDNYGMRIGLIGGSDLMLFGVRYNYSLQ